MRHRASGVGAGAGVPRIWLLPLGLAAALIFVTAAGFLSTAIVADFIAWWPVWALLPLSTLVGFSKRPGRSMPRAIGPVLISIVLSVFVYGHFSRWTVYPSSTQELIGPDSAGVTSAAMSARIDGSVRVLDGGSFLYEVQPRLAGGGVGVPSASEQNREGILSIQLVPPVDPGWYSFAGWDITLDAAPSWSLTLEGNVDADLSGITLDSLEVFGDGAVSLPDVDTVVTASVAGSYSFAIPAGAPVRVVGNASVPSSWAVDGEEATPPAESEGWVILVAEGSSLTVTER